MKKIATAILIAAAASVASADGLKSLESFMKGTQTGKADFTQTVTSPPKDGQAARTKTSSGSFEFQRPGRFKFVYKKPFEQTIVADGQKVWIYDADLNQVSSRKLSAAIGATPAALLAGGNLEKDFELSPLPAADGLEWTAAKPKAKEGSFESLKVGFRGKELAAVEIVDSFGQRSLLQFSQFKPNAATAADAFKFVVPKGADVVEQ